MVKMLNKIKSHFKNMFNKKDKNIFVIERCLYNSRFEPIGYVDSEENATKYCEENTKEHHEYRYFKLRKLKWKLEMDMLAIVRVVATL